MTFDEPEHDRWVRAAAEHLAAARHTEAGGFYAAAVLHAEQATQSTLMALLHGVGVPQRARGHDLLALSRACAEEAGLIMEDPDRASLAELGLQYQPMRYPDALPSGTPGDWFGPEAAAAALATAERITSAASHRWSRGRRTNGVTAWPKATPSPWSPSPPASGSAASPRASERLAY